MGLVFDVGVPRFRQVRIGACDGRSAHPNPSLLCQSRANSIALSPCLHLLHSLQGDQLCVFPLISGIGHGCFRRGISYCECTTVLVRCVSIMMRRSKPVPLIPISSSHALELEDILHLRSDSNLTALDFSLRSFISLCASYHGNSPIPEFRDTPEPFQSQSNTCKILCNWNMRATYS